MGPPLFWSQHRCKVTACGIGVDKDSQSFSALTRQNSECYNILSIDFPFRGEGGSVHFSGVFSLEDRVVS